MSVQAARHVCNTYYTDTRNPIVQYHINSYDDLVTRQIPLFLKASNPIKLLLPSEKRSIDVFIGGREGTAINYTPFSSTFGCRGLNVVRGKKRGGLNSHGPVIFACQHNKRE